MKNQYHSLFKDTPSVISSPIGKYYYTHAIGNNFNPEDIPGKWIESKGRIETPYHIDRFISHINSEKDQQSLVENLKQIDKNTGYLVLEKLMDILTRHGFYQSQKKHWAKLKKECKNTKTRIETAIDKMIKAFKEDHMPEKDLDEVRNYLERMAVKTVSGRVFYELEEATTNDYPHWSGLFVKKAPKGHIETSKANIAIKDGIKRIADLLEAIGYSPPQANRQLATLFNLCRIPKTGYPDWDENDIKRYRIHT